jgi:hypothetical protein
MIRCIHCNRQFIKALGDFRNHTDGTWEPRFDNEPCCFVVELLEPFLLKGKQNAA